MTGLGGNVSILDSHAGEKLEEVVARGQTLSMPDTPAHPRSLCRVDHCLIVRTLGDPLQGSLSNIVH